MLRSTPQHHRHSNQKCDLMMRRHVTTWAAAVALVLFAAVVPLASQTLADDFFQETHVFNLGVDTPAFDSVFEYNFDLPLFNTAGGTREIIGFQVDYFLYSDYTYAMNPNPTGYWHGCDLSWEQTWTSTLDGQQWFPLDQSSGYLDATTGVGAVVAPFFEGSDPFEVDGAGIGHWEVHADANLLELLTGDGVATVVCTHTLSELMAIIPGDRWWPAHVPPNERIFDPDLIDLTLDHIGMDVTVTYFWTPEPGSLALLLCGALPLLRRR